MSQNQYDDGARPAARSNGAGGAHRVTFGPFALLVGTGVTHLLLATAIGVSFGWARPWETFSFIALAAIMGLPFAIGGCVVALILGLILRPVGNQTLHVAAFFVVFALVPGAISLLAGGNAAALLLVSLGIGTAAAVGRTSVWKLVRVHPRKTTTAQHPAA